MVWDATLFPGKDAVSDARKAADKIRSAAGDTPLDDTVNNALVGVAALDHMMARPRKPSNDDICRAIRKTLGNLSVIAPEAKTDELHAIDAQLREAHGVFNPAAVEPDENPLPDAEAAAARAEAAEAPAETPAE